MGKKIMIILLVALPLCWGGCRSNSAASRQHQVEKQREEKDKEANKMYEEGKERHLKNQSAKTKNNMKANKAKSDKKSYVKKPCFLKRWFSRKPNTCPKGE